ncbi:MAG TPA: VWA domain-containing protein [Chryseolinea sp.]|nr:VWA domain-containing protein [Chryseolinea sp.]
MITSAQQKALNSFVDYANQSADETAAVVQSIIDYYPRIHQKSSWGVPRFTCPVQLEDYYYNTALAQTKGLSAAISNALSSKVKDLRSAAERIDEKCKALDTYHKLEDYKQDNFAKAELMIAELQLLLGEYKKRQFALQQELDASYKKLHASASANAYHKADEMMRAEVERERSILDMWNFNVVENVHTGWPVDKFEQSILETDTHLAALQNFKPVLKYPASSMWTSFQGSLGSVLTSKRSGLDEYNYEAKKSDKHSNDVYLGLINYFNGTLVSDFNTFVQFSERDGYYGLKSIKYFPLFEIRTQTKMVEVAVKPYKDIPHSPVPATPQRIALSKPLYEVLTNYIDYINESYRQTRYMQMVLTSFNSTAMYYKGLESFEKRGAMSFDYKDFQLPLSQYQKTVADSKSLSPAIAKSLNDQTEVIMNILKEMNDLGALLEIEAKEKRYERDHLKKVYEIMERQKVLLEAWDEKKEVLYQDVRKVVDSYPIAQGTSSWYISGKALQGLTDLDHEGLFNAKAYYKGTSSGPVATEKIDEGLRTVISKEFDNMKGIDKLGRYNGLCPYTPYEDLPVTSKALSEELKKLKAPTSSNEHPYHRMVYHYNDIVDDYNKFCELSHDVLHLKTIKQPELFDVKYPKAKDNAVQEGAVPVAITVATQLPETKTSVQKDPVKENPVVQRETKVQHDTIYIEKRDTVYLAEPGENLRSMEGYATNNMILLLDVSGSMNTPEKLPLLKSSVLDLLSMMRSEDEVSIISFSEKPKALLTATSFKEESKIKKAISDLKPSGKTDGNAGLKLAYKVADENYVRGGNNRIILATDGEFALSDETRELIEKFSREDIFLSIFNFGKGAGSSKALEKLAGLGKGNYEQVSKENVDLQLIREAKAKKKK